MCDHAAEKIAPLRIACFVRGSFLGVMYGCLRSSELERLVAPISWTSLCVRATPVPSCLFGLILVAVTFLFLVGGPGCRNPPDRGSQWHLGEKCSRFLRGFVSL